VEVEEVGIEEHCIENRKDFVRDGEEGRLDF